MTLFGLESVLVGELKRKFRMITADEFRDFVFANAVKLWTAINPDFFKGTAVESEVDRLLAQN